VFRQLNIQRIERKGIHLSFGSFGANCCMSWIVFVTAPVAEAIGLAIVSFLPFPPQCAGLSGWFGVVCLQLRSVLGFLKLVLPFIQGSFLKLGQHYGTV